MILDAETYISHYGKKGMKWGKRSSNSGSAQKSKKNNTKRNVAIATAVVGIGALAVGLMLKNKGSIPVNEITLQRLPKAKMNQGEQYVKSMESARQAVLKSNVNKINHVKPDPKWDMARSIMERSNASVKRTRTADDDAMDAARASRQELTRLHLERRDGK